MKSIFQFFTIDLFKFSIFFKGKSLISLRIKKLFASHTCNFTVFIVEVQKKEFFSGKTEILFYLINCEMDAYYFKKLKILKFIKYLR